jgi:hypothetical protein
MVCAAPLSSWVMGTLISESLLKKIVTIQYGLVLKAKRPFCEVALPFFRMRDSKAICAKTGKRFEAFRPSF